MSNREIPALTSLRMIAALLVLAFHFQPRGPSLLVAVAREGHVGVTVFFVLSGFLITLRYFDRAAEGRLAWGDYFVRRFARIAPLYYVVLGLSLLFWGESVFSWHTLPEWTLTQGLFGESLHRLAVPTSWSLTVEECFYALAPVIFASLAFAWRRAGHPVGAALGLLGWTGLLAALGLGIAALVPETGPGFISTPREILTRTLAGRFVDFALGVGAGLLYRSGRVAALWARREGSAIATTVALFALGLGHAAQRGMTAAGGSESDTWVAAWRFDPVVAAASAVLILCLTAEQAPLSRALAFAPFVYLGRISYALYLVQMTPLGKDLLYRLLPSHHALTLPLLYAGMILMAVLLYELIEEPARRAILRAWDGRAGDDAAPAGGWWAPAGSAAALAVLGLAVGGQLALWVESSTSRVLGPVSRDAAVGAAREGQVLVVDREGLRSGDGIASVKLPRAWSEGWRDDQRAPRTLLVFADDTPIPFLPSAASSGSAAWVVGRRVRALAVRVPEGVRQVTVVQGTPAVLLALSAERIAQAPGSLALAGGLLLGGLAVGRRTLRAWPAPPVRQWATAGFAAVLVWCALDLAAFVAAPVIVVVELALLPISVPLRRVTPPAPPLRLAA